MSKRPVLGPFAFLFVRLNIFTIFASFSHYKKTVHKLEIMIDRIIVEGKKLEFQPVPISRLKGLYADALLNFNFYETKFAGYSFLLLEAKKENKLRPLQYVYTAKRVSAISGLPTVFLFNDLKTYERNRMIERGVLYIVSGKYVHLPFLLVNAKDSTPVKTDHLTPASQYLLLYHLQKQSLEGLSLKELEQLVPYQYVTISRAVRQLEALKICKISLDERRFKHLHFNYKGKELWDRISSIAISPLKTKFFSDNIMNEGVTTSYNALAAYSHLNPESEEYRAFTEDEFKILKSGNKFKNINQIDGDMTIEIWKYPPIILKSEKIADPLSVYLLLKNDTDERVMDELNYMLEKLW